MFSIESPPSASLAAATPELALLAAAAATAAAMAAAAAATAAAAAVFLAAAIPVPALQGATKTTIRIRSHQMRTTQGAIMVIWIWFCQQFLVRNG